MSVEVRPLGDRCNIKCTYCYQEGTRSAVAPPLRYDVDAMIDRLERLGEPFSLFGGEIMMVRDSDLERLFDYGLRRHGGCGLQTNGTLVQPHHVELFRRYNVRVGVSIDGPASLNDARWAGSARSTRRATARTEGLIETLARAGCRPNVIVTLHRMNAGPERLPILCDWIRFLDTLDIGRVRLHALEVDSEAVSEQLKLSAEEAGAALRTLQLLERRLVRLRFDVFAEIEAMLVAADERASCIFHACDSYATAAVTGVEGDGGLTNCGRTNKDGLGYLKARRSSYARQIALHSTPWADGGCQGCRFFLMCKGNCPGTAIDGDWRLRSADCALWYRLFEDAEKALVERGELPLSLDGVREDVERLAIEAWRCGLNPPLAKLRQLASGGSGSPVPAESGSE